MKSADAVEFYGTQAAIADLLGVSRQAVHKWGSVVPYYSATRLHELSGRRIALRPEHYGPGGRRIVAGRAA